MNILKPHHDCYESPEPEIDFDKINDKLIKYDFPQKNEVQVISIFSRKPDEHDDIKETTEERLKRLKLELGDLKEEIEFLGEKEKLFKGNAEDEELNLLKDIQKLEEEMMEVIKAKGFDSILSNNIQNEAGFHQNLKFIQEQEKSKILDRVFKKIDV